MDEQLQEGAGPLATGLQSNSNLLLSVGYIFPHPSSLLSDTAHLSILVHPITLPYTSQAFQPFVLKIIRGASDIDR